PQDPVHRTELRDAARLAGHVVVDPGGELREVHVGVEPAQVAGGQRLALELVAPPGRASGRTGRVTRDGQRLAGAEGDVEEGGRARCRAGAAGVYRVGRGLRQEIAAVRLVPQAHASREANHLAAGVPGGVRHTHLDLAAAGVDRDERSGPADG